MTNSDLSRTLPLRREFGKKATDIHPFNQRDHWEGAMTMGKADGASIPSTDCWIKASATILSLALTHNNREDITVRGQGENWASLSYFV
jgi:hypothetical protein